MLDKNSRNSSKPPSTDSYARKKKQIQSQRKKTNKSVGGQNDHPSAIFDGKSFVPELEK
jgi:hypothetical protein